MGYSNPQESGASLEILDDGVSLATGVKSIDFVGGGVAGTATGTAVTETITGSGVDESRGEIPSGDINGVNTDFVCAHAPTAGTLQVYLGGTRRTLTEDYTVAGDTITFLTAPRVGQNIVVDYLY